MEGFGKRWTVQDRQGNLIYLSQERWEHILQGHPEMAEFEEHLQTVVKRGKRRQEPLNPRKYRYTHPFDDLPDEHNHIVVIALFGFDVDERGETTPNNFIATAFMKHIRQKGNPQ